MRVQNYPKDHKDIELLRLKSFTVGKAFTDAEVVSSDFSDRVLAAFKHMEPLVSVRRARSHAQDTETANGAVCI